MRERMEMVGGRFSIVSLPGKGTMVEAIAPISNLARKNLHP
jgi:signal transduction histidine kinase